MRAVALPRSRAPFALAAALLAALLVLVPAARADAHDQLIGSDPASGSRVETLPDEISLSFSAALIDASEGTAVVVTDPTGNVVSTGDAEIDGAVVRQGLDASGAPAGEYTVQWTVVSSDGHPTDGEFSFTAASGAAPEDATPTPIETEHTTDETAAPSDETAAPTTPVADDPDMDAGFSLSVPWIIGIAVVALILIFLLIVMVSRRRGPQHPDSDAPAER